MGRMLPCRGPGSLQRPLWRASLQIIRTALSGDGAHLVLMATLSLLPRLSKSLGNFTKGSCGWGRSPGLVTPRGLRT
eukprot:9759360-Karenia_brevis.AAC.1